MNYKERIFTTTDGSVFDSEQKAIEHEITSGISKNFIFYSLEYIDSCVVHNSTELENFIANCNIYDNTSRLENKLSFPCVILKFKNKDGDVGYKFLDEVIESYEVMCMKLNSIKNFADNNFKIMNNQN